MQDDLGCGMYRQFCDTIIPHRTDLTSPDSTALLASPTLSQTSTTTPTKRIGSRGLFTAEGGCTTVDLTF